MKRIKSLVASAVFAFATAAAADPMITVDWANNNIFWPYSGVGVGTVTHPGGAVNALAGRFYGSVTASDIDPSELIDDEFDFFAYCHDLAQLIGPGADYRVQFGASADMLDWLGAVNYVLNGNVNGGDPFAWLHPANKQTAAAIQLGIWEAMHANDFDLLSGPVRFSAVPGSLIDPNSVLARYTAFNTARTTVADSLDGQYVMRLINDRYQDVITGRNPPQLLVPEPGTLVLLGLAAALAGLARRRHH